MNPFCHEERQNEERKEEISNMKVIVGMSGGVDSAVSALLLKQSGYEVEGLFMKNWEEDDTDSFCSATEDLKDAESVCNKLDIPLHTVNFSKEYWESVFEYFLIEHQKGRTPNPDVLCNREIKFKVFLNYAMSLGADLIATGHYVKKEEVKVEENNGNSERGNNGQEKFYLKKGIDPNKDQSYFLYTATQESLSKSLFPIGDYQKETVRELANKAGFQNHRKKDSTGLCFIGERKFKEFLQRFVSKKPGNIISTEGKVLGSHDGLMFYTLGQRQGLGIGGQSNTDNNPWYVVEKNLEENALIVAQGEHHPLLYKMALKATDIHWINDHWMNDHTFSCTAKIRYRQKEVPCTIRMEGEAQAFVQFETPQRAVTPGQSIVFYQDSYCLGGGIIQ